jgi:hypothetical protein
MQREEPSKVYSDAEYKQILQKEKEEIERKERIRIEKLNKEYKAILNCRD